MQTTNSINAMAKRSHAIAQKRGQLNEQWYISLMEEVVELTDEVEKEEKSGFRVSDHIPFTALEEEIADVMLVCMTTLHAMNVNIEKLLKTKIEFNETRDRKD